MLGFRTDFLAVSHLDCQQKDMPLLSGTTHKDRVLVQKPKTRQLLVKYSGITGRSKIPKASHKVSLAHLKANVAKEGFQVLADLTYTLELQSDPHMPRSLQGLSF